MNLKYPIPADFLQEEVRRDYTISETMKKAWAVQLDLLQELMRVCNKHGLRVFVDSGTLIGAVREQGFIPWDDDIDVAMLRDDYDKLMAVADEFRDPFFLQSTATHEYYINRYAQLHMRGTAAIRQDVKPQRHAQSIFIDIFVIDTMPSNPRAFKNHYRKVRNVCQKLKLVRTLTFKLPESLYRWCRNHTKLLSDKYWYGEFEKVVRSVPRDNRKAYGAIVCQRMTLPIKHLACYDEALMLPFEHIQVPVPVGYDELLRLEYGDYMKPVKAPTQHGTMLFDAERSYEYYTKNRVGETK